MRAHDLDLDELLEVDPVGGRLRFARQRALIFDAVALGLLRKQLVELLGPAGARGVLTRFGFSHGWRSAEALERGFPWEDVSEWRRAGGRLHTLQGLVRVEPLANQGGPGQGSAIWHDSYEAEQHLLHLGRSEEPVCWTLSGYASGYMTRVHGSPVYALERRCVGRGDAICQLEAHPKEDWAPAELEGVLPFYEEGCLAKAMRSVCSSLRKAERKLHRARRAREPEPPEEVEGLVARSEAMRKVVGLAQRVARVDSTVLITGESGVGKERLAQLIHDASSRTARPWIALNCGAVAENLIESELFGHAKGAFTGATRERVGLFEAAAGGTLFLDEVGELPLQTQVKLLRVLQEREVRRLGENEPRRIDVRVVAATNVDLEQAVKEGRFRRDLLYRLKVIELQVPPLRERPDDVLPLARHLLSELATRLGSQAEGFTPQAADQLLRYPWPGNVRELSNAVERALVVAQGARIERDDLPEGVRCAGEAGTPSPAREAAARSSAEVRPLAEVERDAILSALAANEGARGETARALGIGVATLYRKLKRYEAEGVEVPEPGTIPAR